MDAIDKIRHCVRPVIFLTGIPATPYSTAGTAFLVGFGHSVLIITAKHVLQNYPPEKLIVYPSNKSKKHIRIIDWWDVHKDSSAPDYSDIIVLKADMDSMPKKDRVDGQLLFLSPSSSTEWFDSRFTASYFLCGHPHEINEVDYDATQINTGQVLLPAKFVGPSKSAGCYALRTENPLNISSFNGLSGSPVFCYQNAFPLSLAPTTSPKFCGMVLRGGAEAGIVHFLSADVIVNVLQEAAQSESLKNGSYVPAARRTFAHFQ
jgi:hypothetical protein